MNAKYPEKNVVISGVGQSEIGRPSNKSALRLSVEAANEAIADAGLELGDIDGIACWPGDIGDAFSPVGAAALKSALGLNVGWYGSGYEGPGPIASLINGAMAIAAGLANHVLVFRTIHESTARRADPESNSLANKSPGRDNTYYWQRYTPFNAVSAVNFVAMYAQRHFHDYGTTSEQLGQIPITCRRHAGLNPKAVFRKPLTLDDYMSSRLISSPLRLFDCDVHCDASTAIILSRRGVRPGPNPPIRIEAIGSALEPAWTWDQLPLTEMATQAVGRMMWSRTDLTPRDVDTAQLYDGFSMLTMIWLEGLGFCPVGEGGRFVEGGHRISIDGELPLNTNGGQLSGGRTHGLGYVMEACLQLWGRAEQRQIKKRDVAVVAAGAGPLGGSVLLVRE